MSSFAVTSPNRFVIPRRRRKGVAGSGVRADELVT
jgi:hypothetical protein